MIRSTVNLVIASTIAMTVSCAHAKNPETTATASAPPAVDGKKLDAYFDGLNQAAEKSIGAAIHYGYDKKTFSVIDADTLDSVQEVVGGAEYQLRLIAKRDQLTKDKLLATVKNVVILGGTRAANSDSDFEWKVAQSEATEAIAKANPNDILYDEVGQVALDRHFLNIRLEGSTLILACQLKNCMYARRGSQDLGDRLLDLVLR